jgi:hypothetical protein
MGCRVKPGNDARETNVTPGNDALETQPGYDMDSYCKLSATKRNSPSEFATSNSTDFLPSFFN